MDESQAKLKIEELRKTLEYHAKKYYDEDKPEISDYEYDNLFDDVIAHIEWLISEGLFNEEYLNKK